MTKRDAKSLIRSQLYRKDMFNYFTPKMAYCIERSLLDKITAAHEADANLDQLRALIPVFEVHARRLAQTDPGQSEGTITVVGMYTLPNPIPFVVTLLSRKLYVTSKAMMPWESGEVQVPAGIH